MEQFTSNLEGKEKLKIDTVEDLYNALPEEFKSHKKENDNDLSDVTIENLEAELETAISQRENKTGYFDEDRSDNYVPEYYGIGLISRACALAKEAGYELDSKFDGLNY